MGLPDTKKHHLYKKSHSMHLIITLVISIIPSKHPQSDVVQFERSKVSGSLVLLTQVSLLLPSTNFLTSLDSGSQVQTLEVLLTLAPSAGTPNCRVFIP